MIRHTGDPFDETTRLDELESLQDEVITELDRLNDRIEALLREHGMGRELKVVGGS